MTNGVLDPVPLARIEEAEHAIRRAVTEKLPEICRDIHAGNPFPQESREQFLKVAQQAVDALLETG